MALCATRISSVQQVRELVSDVAELRGVMQVAGADPVDARRSEIAIRIDEGLPTPFRLQGRVELDHADFDDPVVGVIRQAGGLDVDHRERRCGGHLVEGDHDSPQWVVCS